MKAETDITCSDVDARDLDLQYLRDELSAGEREAFEAHYFACDRCWGLVQGGLEVSASRPAAPRTARSSAARIPRSVPWLTAALVLVTVGVGLWRFQDRPAPVPPALERTAGAGGLVVNAQADGGDLSLVWDTVPRAATYRIRLFGPSGEVVTEREVAGTTFALARDSVAQAGPLYWQVYALDPMGDELARSALIDAQPLPAR